MKFLPYETFEIQTRLTSEEIIATLNAKVDLKGILHYSCKTPFEGDVFRDGFKIKRIIYYANAFLPIILGTFKQTPTGINIMIRMRLRLFVLIFMCIWFGGVIVGLFVVGNGMATGEIPLSPPDLIPLALLIGGWAMMSGGFWLEVRKAKPLLLSILQGQVSCDKTP